MSDALRHDKAVSADLSRCLPLPMVERFRVFDGRALPAVANEEWFSCVVPY